MHTPYLIIHTLMPSLFNSDYAYISYILWTWVLIWVSYGLPIFPVYVDIFSFLVLSLPFSVFILWWCGALLLNLIIIIFCWYNIYLFTLCNFILSLLNSILILGWWGGRVTPLPLLSPSVLVWGSLWYVYLLSLTTW